MQNSSIVTRCPQCQTAFRVTHAQINIAKGAVRCGSCLSIFKALDHVDTKNNAPASQATKTKATKTKATAKASVATAAKTKPATKAEPAKTKNTFSLDIDEELLQDNDSIDDEVDQESDDFYFYDKETPPANKNTSIFGATTTKPVTESTQEKADESWALDILAELEDDDDEEEPLSINLSKRKQVQPENKEIDKTEATEKVTPKNTAAKNLLNTIEPDDALEITPTKDGFDNTIGYEELIDDENLDQPLVEAQQGSDNTDNEADDLAFYYDESFETNTQSTHQSNDETKPLHEDFDEDLENLISDEDIDHAMDTAPSYKQELQGMIKGIQSAPVEMGAYENEERRKWLWRIALIFVALLLITQFMYFRFDSLSKHPSYRPILTQVCNITGCQMPALVAVDQIRSNNLIVRTHPTAANALLVDVILINNASFEQPYPALSLEFSTLGNSLLAASEIQPRQYLRGELAGSHLMPVKQPIQVSLSIEDPGSNAVNYQLNIFSAELSP